jgi:acid phosphatase family membrane protein YuiD
MTRIELDAALQAIAERRASGAEHEDINEMIAELAQRSGHSFAFVRSNTGHRLAEIRAARWRDQQRNEAAE